jgi:hypothetical protein
MSKNINFRARSKTEFEVQIKPYPAVKQLPDWFVNAEPYTIDHNSYSDNKVHVRNTFPNATFKKCVPLLDGMSSGYIIPLWTDVEVAVENDSPQIYWKQQSSVFALHGPKTKEIVSPPGYYSQVFKYNNCWIPQTPKGYSCLIVSPFGYSDLPFKAVPAIVDTDRSTLELVFPIWVKENFEGIVEKGTPIVQIIPFKRDDWKSTFDYYQDGEYKNIIESKNFNSTIVGHYLKNHHSKKKFK